MPMMIKTPVKGITFILGMLMFLFAAIAWVDGLYLIAVIAGLFGIGFMYISNLLDANSRSDAWSAATLEAVEMKIDQALRPVIIFGYFSAKDASFSNRVVSDVQAIMHRYDGPARLCLHWFSVNLENNNELGFLDDVLTAHQDQNVVWMGESELAGLWGVPAYEVIPSEYKAASVERRFPNIEDVSHGTYPVAKTTKSDGSPIQVCLPKSALDQNMLVLGKTGSGKSSLMAPIVLSYLMANPGSGVVMFDPHADLADVVVTMLPESMQDRVYVFDLTGAMPAFGSQSDIYFPTINIVDPIQMGMTPFAISSMLNDAGQALFANYWGERMARPIENAVRALAVANAVGGNGKWSLAAVPALLLLDKPAFQRFARDEMAGAKGNGNSGISSAYENVMDYFLMEYYGMAEASASLRWQVILPALSRLSRFREPPTSLLLSTQHTTLDIRGLLNEGAIVIFKVSKSMEWGDGIVEFVGSIWMNIIMSYLQNTPVPYKLVADEFQMLSGVPWEEHLAQDRKFGVSYLLGTQTLAGLQAGSFSGDKARSISQITGNMWGLFALGMAGEEEDMVLNEFGESNVGRGVFPNLPQYEGWAKYSNAGNTQSGGGMVRPFWFKTNPAPAIDPLLVAAAIARGKKYCISPDIARIEASTVREEIGLYKSYMVSSTGVPQVYGGAAQNAASDVAHITPVSAAATVVSNEADAALADIGAFFANMGSDDSDDGRNSTENDNGAEPDGSS